MIAAPNSASCEADVVRLYTPPAIIHNVMLSLESNSPLWVSCTAPDLTRGAILGLVRGTGLTEILGHSFVSSAPSIDLPLTCGEMVKSLSTKGLSISALAEILEVTRTTIYSWVNDNSEPQKDKQARIETAFKFLGNVDQKRLVLMSKVWNRKLGDTPSLYEALTSKTLREDVFLAALNSIEPLFQKFLARDKKSRQTVDQLVESTLIAESPILGEWDRLPALVQEIVDGSPV